MYEVFPKYSDTVISFKANQLKAFSTELRDYIKELETLMKNYNRTAKELFGRQKVTDLRKNITQLCKVSIKGNSLQLIADSFVDGYNYPSSAALEIPALTGIWEQFKTLAESGITIEFDSISDVPSFSEIGFNYEILLDSLEAISYLAPDSEVTAGFGSANRAVFFEATSQHTQVLVMPIILGSSYS